MSELDMACRNLKALIRNPYAVHRYYERKRGVLDAWKVMSTKSVARKQGAKK